MKKQNDPWDLLRRIANREILTAMGAAECSRLRDLLSAFDNNQSRVDNYATILTKLVDRWKTSSYSQYDGPFVTQLAKEADAALTYGKGDA